MRLVTLTTDAWQAILWLFRLQSSFTEQADAVTPPRSATTTSATRDIGKELQIRRS